MTPRSSAALPQLDLGKARSSSSKREKRREKGNSDGVDKCDSGTPKKKDKKRKKRADDDDESDIAHAAKCVSNDKKKVKKQK